MGSCCFRGKSSIGSFGESSPPVQNASPVCSDKRRRRLSMNQGTDMGFRATSSSDTEVDETYQQGRIVIGDEPHRRSDRRLSITSQAVAGPLSQQKGFADKMYEKQGTTVPTTIGYVCKKGLKPDSPNQDDFDIVISDDSEIYAVFDGHGPCGHIVSKLCQELLPDLITNDPNFEDDLSKAFKTAFIRTHVLCEHIAESQDNFDCSFSGSTATIVLRRDDSLYCAWVGDSRAVLATIKSSLSGNRLVAVDLSRDHKPELPDERARIESQGGRVLRLGGDIPYRVFVKSAFYPGLAMTRSIGDIVGVSAGISHIPEVSEQTINESADKFVIVASDGVWEFISSQEAVDIINKYPPSEAQTAAEALAYEAWLRWIKEECGKVVDDITVIVTWLHPSI